MSSCIHRYLGFAAITVGLFASWGLGCVAAAEPDETTARNGELEAVPEEEQVGEAEGAASDCSVCQYRYCDVTGPGRCAKYSYWYHTCPGLPSGWGGPCSTTFYSCNNSCP
ncbi:hypothetical protein [Sorangium sp. So ce381]|uniref:hypothetical protein n=1 Tax=Sorangium sp. So ce381 TaxID=3133307 RepID=UPI003F5B00A7